MLRGEELLGIHAGEGVTAIAEFAVHLDFFALAQESL